MAFLPPSSLCDACPDARPRVPRGAVNQQPVMHAHGPHKVRHGPAIRPETTVTWAPRRCAGGCQRSPPPPSIQSRALMVERGSTPPSAMATTTAGPTPAARRPTPSTTVARLSRAAQSPTADARADAVAEAGGPLVATDHRRVGRGGSSNRGGSPPGTRCRRLAAGRAAVTSAAAAAASQGGAGEASRVLRPARPAGFGTRPRATARPCPDPDPGR